jgi:hypothetical protein
MSMTVTETIIETEGILFEISNEIEDIVTEKLHQIHEDPKFGGDNYNRLHSEAESKKYLQSIEDYAALVRFDVGTKYGHPVVATADELRLAQVKMMSTLVRMLK